MNITADKSIEANLQEMIRDRLWKSFKLTRYTESEEPSEYIVDGKIRRYNALANVQVNVPKTQQQPG